MISIKLQGVNKVDEELELALKSVCGDDSVEVIAGKGFTGIEELNYILSIGGGIAISQISSILKSYISRNKEKSVKIGDIEIKGYSEDKIIEVIKQATDKKDEQ